MERVTEKTKNGSYQLKGGSDEQKAVERLAGFENVYEALTTSITELEEKMGDLKDQGRTNSATFRQLFGKKLNYENLLNMLAIHGVE